MRKSIVVASAVLAGLVATTAPASAESESGVSTYGSCVADGQYDPAVDYVGPLVVVDGRRIGPDAEPPGQSWDFVWACPV